MKTIVSCIASYFEYNSSLSLSYPQSYLYQELYVKDVYQERLAFTPMFYKLYIKPL